MTPAVSLLAAYEGLLARGGMQPDAGQRDVVLRLDSLAACLRSHRPSAFARLMGRIGAARAAHAPCRGLYLWGGVGRGKTWLMDEFCSLLGPAFVQRLHFHHFMRDIHARLHQIRHRDQPLALVAAQFASRSRVLCLDEFHVLDIGDAMILHGLLAGLLERGVVMVMTSNTPPGRLYEGGLQRERFLPAIALLEQHLDVVEIAAGPDYRLRELSTSGTWLDSSRADSPARMDALFRRLAGAAPLQDNVTVRLVDRPVQALRTAAGMAWFDFDALCEGPRATEDYILLAEELHTLFLSHVPVFDDSRNDAARRFISLIDEMYDRDVKMVISAAAGPAQLYRGQRLAAPFERTASRLIEMRGNDYLSHAHQGHAVIRQQPEDASRSGAGHRA